MAALAISCSVAGLPGPLDAATAAPLSEQEARGRRVFAEGLTTGDAGTALIGSQSLKVPASRMPCASCHGIDGTGRPEGGVSPPDIRWSQLIKPYGHVHASGRAHGAFDSTTLRRAITEGVDPSGNRIDPAMPRYQLSSADLDDLLAFMKRLGTSFAPGVDDSTVRIGTFVPRHGPTTETGQAMRAVMAAYFAEINRQGGLYGRRVELVALDLGKDSSEAPKQAHDSLAQVLAVVGALVAGAEAELLPLLEGQAVPLVGPVTLFPQPRESAKASTFYLLAGVLEQAAALAEFAGRRLERRNARVAVVQPLGSLFEGVAGAVLSRADNFGWTSAGTLTYQRFDAAALVRRLADQKVDLVFFFGSSAELEAFQKQADRTGWSPSLFTSGSLSGMPSAGSAAATATATAPQVSVAYPMLPSDQSAAGRAELHALHVRYGLSEKHLPAQIYALSAAKVLVEGLKRAGRELTRERLVDALEQLDRFDTGLTPRISFGPNRRVGAAGAHVVAAKAPAARAGPADTWVLLDPP